MKTHYQRNSLKKLSSTFHKSCGKFVFVIKVQLPLKTRFTEASHFLIQTFFYHLVFLTLVHCPISSHVRLVKDSSNSTLSLATGFEISRHAATTGNNCQYPCTVHYSMLKPFWEDIVFLITRDKYGCWKFPAMCNRRNISIFFKMWHSFSLARVRYSMCLCQALSKLATEYRNIFSDWEEGVGTCFLL